MPKSKQVYQFKITLNYTKPLIWRRVLIEEDRSLHDLHWVIQAVMDWDNSHLHEFMINGEYYDEKHSPGWGPQSKAIDEEKTWLKNVLHEKDKFLYTYDFGDNWEHEILVEKIIPIQEGQSYPICLKGKLAAPPDDCGSIPGYYRTLDILSDPQDPEYEETREWMGLDKGKTYDPEKFDIDDVNEALKHIPLSDKVSRLKLTQKIGRNEPCICESGKKYKKCCYLR